MSLVSPMESLGRNGQVFLKTSASPHFSTRFEIAFGAPKLCSFSQSHYLCAPLTLKYGPKSTHELHLAPDPISASRHKFEVRCEVKQGENPDSCHLSAWTYKCLCLQHRLASRAPRADGVPQCLDWVSTPRSRGRDSLSASKVHTRLQALLWPMFHLPQ